MFYRIGIFIFLLISVITNIALAEEYSKYSANIDYTLKAGNRRDISRLGVLVPVKENKSGLLFSNIFGLYDSRDAVEINLGFGYRELFKNCIVGGAIFYDKRKSNSGNIFSQLTFSVEYFRRFLELRLNGYVPIGKISKPSESSKTYKPLSYIKVTQSGFVTEKALWGYDVELGGNLPELERLSGHVAYYHFNDNAINPIHGIRFRAGFKLSEYISIEGELAHDRLRAINYLAGFRVHLELGGKSKSQLLPLERKMTQMVIRDIDIITDSVEDSYRDDEGKERKLQIDWNDDGNFIEPTEEELKDIELSIDVAGTASVMFKGARKPKGYLRDISSKQSLPQPKRVLSDEELIFQGKELSRANALELLGLTVNSTDRDIKKAYRKLAKHHHPDKGGDGNDFNCLREAYDLSLLALTGDWLKFVDVVKKSAHKINKIFSPMGFGMYSNIHQPLNNGYGHLHGNSGLALNLVPANNINLPNSFEDQGVVINNIPGSNDISGIVISDSKNIKLIPKNLNPNIPAKDQLISIAPYDIRGSITEIPVGVIRKHKKLFKDLVQDKLHWRVSKYNTGEYCLDSNYRIRGGAKWNIGVFFKSVFSGGSAGAATYKGFKHGWGAAGAGLAVGGVVYSILSGNLEEADRAREAQTQEEWDRQQEELKKLNESAGNLHAKANETMDATIARFKQENAEKEKRSIQGSKDAFELTKKEISQRADSQIEMLDEEQQRRHSHLQDNLENNYHAERDALGKLNVPNVPLNNVMGNFIKMRLSRNGVKIPNLPTLTESEQNSIAKLEYLDNEFAKKLNSLNSARERKHQEINGKLYHYRQFELARKTPAIGGSIFFGLNRLQLMGKHAVTNEETELVNKGFTTLQKEINSQAGENLDISKMKQSKHAVEINELADNFWEITHSGAFDRKSLVNIFEGIFKIAEVAKEDSSLTKPEREIWMREFYKFKRGLMAVRISRSSSTNKLPENQIAYNKAQKEGRFIEAVGIAKKALAEANNSTESSQWQHNVDIIASSAQSEQAVINKLNELKQRLDDNHKNEFDKINNEKQQIPNKIKAIEQQAEERARIKTEQEKNQSLGVDSDVKQLVVRKALSSYLSKLSNNSNTPTNTQAVLRETSSQLLNDTTVIDSVFNNNLTKSLRYMESMGADGTDVKMFMRNSLKASHSSEAQVLSNQITQEQQQKNEKIEEINQSKDSSLIKAQQKYDQLMIDVPKKIKEKREYYLKFLNDERGRLHAEIDGAKRKGRKTLEQETQARLNKINNWYQKRKKQVTDFGVNVSMNLGNADGLDIDTFLSSKSLPPQLASSFSLYKSKKSNSNSARPKKYFFGIDDSKSNLEVIPSDILQSIAKEFGDELGEIKISYTDDDNPSASFTKTVPFRGGDHAASTLKNISSGIVKKANGDNVFINSPESIVSNAARINSITDFSGNSSRAISANSLKLKPAKASPLTSKTPNNALVKYNSSARGMGNGHTQASLHPHLPKPKWKPSIGLGIQQMLNQAAEVKGCFDALLGIPKECIIQSLNSLGSRLQNQQDMLPGWMDSPYMSSLEATSNAMIMLKTGQILSNMLPSNTEELAIGAALGVAGKAVVPAFNAAKPYFGSIVSAAKNGDRIAAGILEKVLAESGKFSASSLVFPNKIKGAIKIPGSGSKQLNPKQLENIKRFYKKIPANAKDAVNKHKLPNNGIAVQATSKSKKIPDSKAVYEKQIDSGGSTIQYTKTTYGGNGNIIHVKDKMNGQVV